MPPLFNYMDIKILLKLRKYVRYGTINDKMQMERKFFG